MKLLHAFTLAAALLPAAQAQGSAPQLHQPTVQRETLDIEWTSGGELQTAPTPNGPWTAVRDQAQRRNLSTLPTTAENRFFRVVEHGRPTAAMPLVGGDPARPFVVDKAFLRVAPNAAGNALLEMDLLPGQNPPASFPLLSEGQVLVFRDDGQDGDAAAADGRFTAGLQINLEELKAANTFVESLPEAWRVQGLFAGRSLKSGVLPTLFDFERFARSERVQVHPSPFDGRGLAPQGSKVSGASRSSLRALWAPAERVCVTNVLTEPILTVSNIVIKLDDVLLTNIACKTNIVGFTSAFFTNIVCRPEVVGFQEPRRITNINCVEVEVDPVPESGLNRICFTNVVPNPLRFVTNIFCGTEILPQSNAQAVGAVLPQTKCITNITALPGQPLTLTNVVCEDVVIAKPGVPTRHVVCITNVVADGEPIPIVREICVTNLVANPEPQPILERACLTNVVVVPGGDVFTNIVVTNFVFVTNIVCTNVVIGGIDTNVITLPIDDVLKRPAIWNKSLLITDLSVVEDPRRTWDPCDPNRGTKMGAWTFGRLMTDVCNPSASGIDPREFTRRWLRSWQHNLSINFDTVTNRAAEIAANAIRDWEMASGGPGAPLDLSIAPFRLLAIVNRVDLRSNPGYGGGVGDDSCNPACIGGEGRFVFALAPTRSSGWTPEWKPAGGGTGGNDPWSGGGTGSGHGWPTGGVCDPAPFLVIFEYCVPKRTCEEIKEYALQWYRLNTLPFGPEFNNRLQAITDQFAAAGADPSRKPNLSALNQLRSNELLTEPWDMREWRLFNTDSDAGWLREVTVKQTPDFDLNFGRRITEYALANAAEILAGAHTVPLQFKGEPFLGGDAPMPTAGFFWDGPQPTGTIPSEIRHKFSLNTCNGCHAGETGTPFTHVFPRGAGTEAALSDFLTGRNMPKLDPADHATQRFFADLKRREDDLIRLIKEPCFFQLFHRPETFPH